MSQNVVLAFLRRRQYNASIRYPPNPVPSAKALKFNPTSGRGMRVQASALICTLLKCLGLEVEVWGSGFWGNLTMYAGLVSQKHAPSGSTKHE